MSDNLFLICSLMKSIKSWFETFPVSVLHFFINIMYPAVRFSLIFSIYCTVALSHSRYKAVTNPVHVRLAMESQKYKRKYFCGYFFSILIFSAAISAPCFYEYELEKKNNSTEPILTASDLREHPYYAFFYVGIVSLGINGIFPLFLLVFYTIRIYQGIGRNSINTDGQTHTPQGQISSNSRRNSPSMVVYLISVFFIVFHSPRLVITIIYEFYINFMSLNNKDYEIGCKLRYILLILTSVSEFLLIVGTCINTVIYQVVLWKSVPREEPRLINSNELQSTPHRSTNRLERSSSAFPRSRYSNTTQRSTTTDIPPTNVEPDKPKITTALVHGDVTLTNSLPNIFTEISHGDDYEFL